MLIMAIGFFIFFWMILKGTKKVWKKSRKASRRYKKYKRYLKAKSLLEKRFPSDQ